MLLIILGLSVGSMLIVTLISYFSMARLDNSANQVYSFLMDKAGSSSQDALGNLTGDYLEYVSTDRAELYSQNFEAINATIIKYKEYIEYAYQHPALFLGHNVSHVTEARPDIYMEKYTLAPNIEPTAVIMEQLRVLSNFEYIFRPEIENNENMINSFAGTELGLSYRYSPSSSYNPDYDARQRNWYKNAFANPNEIIWTSAYEDTILDKKTVLVTCSTAFRDSSGNVAGVVGIDITVDNLIEKILETQFGINGYAFLLDENGVIIADKNINNAGFVKEPLLQSDISDGYRAVLEKMLKQQKGFEEIEINGEKKYISYNPLSSIAWSIGIVIDVDEVMEPITEMNENLKTISKNAQDDFQKTILGIVLQFVAIFAVLVAMVLVVSLLLSNLLTKPIKELAAGAKMVGQGNLDYVIEVKTHDEIKDFADTFNAMTQDIKEYIHNLAIQTQEKERIASDLRIATDIQADMLPKIFPPFSNRDDLHLAPYMLPAREVGGDFYDFFFLDDEQKKIALVIADVSGKGVPAALFMVIAKVLIKNNKDLPCDKILGAVNNLLAADNNSSMFVTTFFSILDIDTGQYDYASAGHNPPVLYRKESGELMYLSLPKTPPLAIFPGKQFECRSLTLQEGDLLLLYTDGVTEAFNGESVMYGSERLLQNLQLIIEKPVDDIVNDIYASIKEFCGDEPQSDDITMLCCKYLGKGRDRG